MQKFDGEDYRPALPVFFSGECANGGALPLSIAPSPPRLTSSGPQQNRLLPGGTPANFGYGCAAKVRTLFKD